MTPVRLQRSRARGAKLASPNGLPVVYVGRPSKWGNPFVVGVNGWNANQCARAYAEWLGGNNDGNRLADEARLELSGKNLACWCPLDQPCHADVLLELANEELARDIDAALEEQRKRHAEIARTWEEWSKGRRFASVEIAESIEQSS